MSEKFEYKYTAPTAEERKEIDSIRSQYLPENKKMSRIERLRYLDNKVKSIPTVASLCAGVIGLLSFGTSMSFFLEFSDVWFVGIPFAVVGVILIGLAFPLYNRVLKKYKEKYSEEIIQLSNELLNEESN